MDSLDERAERAEHNGDLVSALRLWRELAQADPDPVFLCRYGTVAQELKHWDEAEQAFSQALRLDPAFAPAMECMGDLWASRTDKDDSESLKVAKRWFLDALRLDRNARTLVFLGAVLRALDETAAARDAFAEAVELDPRNAEALYNLAITGQENNHQRAMDLLEQAIDADPGYFSAHQTLGKLHQRNKDLVRAEYHFRRSLEIKPNEFWSLMYLANALAVQGKTDEAEDTYRLAATLHPHEKAGPEFLASFLERIGKHNEAVAVRAGGRPFPP